MFTYHSSINPTQDCASFLFSLLQSQQSHPTLLLWSGGSVAEVAKLLIEKHHQFSNLSWLTMSLVDERYGQPHHQDSNEVLLQSTDIIDQLIEKGGKWEPFLTGLSLKNETNRLDQLFTKYFKTHTIIGIFGVGEDGHTAGVLPIFDNRNDFDQLFNSDQDIVDYDLDQLHNTYPNQFKQRITLSISGINRLNQRIVFAQGEKKREVLQKLKANQQELSHFPAQIFNQTESELFTDQIITK